jgi:hypothetical protein
MSYLAVIEEEKFLQRMGEYNAFKFCEENLK